MMYLDSSILLSRYFRESRSREAEEIWLSEGDFVSSGLTVAEVIVTLRRSVTRPSSRPAQKWLKGALERAEADFLRVSVSYDLAGPLQRVWKDARLSSCRASDALHVATALWFHGETGRPLEFASLDQRQREVALRCGLALLPP